MSRRPFVSKLERDALNHIAVFPNLSKPKFTKKKVEKQGKNESEPIYFSIVDRNSWKTCVCGERVKGHVSAGKWIPSLRKDREGERGRGEGKKRSRRLIIHHEVKL